MNKYVFYFCAIKQNNNYESIIYLYIYFQTFVQLL